MTVAVAILNSMSIIVWYFSINTYYSTYSFHYIFSMLKKYKICIGLIFQKRNSECVLLVLLVIYVYTVM